MAKMNKKYFVNGGMRDDDSCRTGDGKFLVTAGPR